MSTIHDIAEACRKGEIFAICGHVNPDGDTVGSVLGMLALLRGMGKQATPLLANASHAPQKYAFLYGFEDYIHATHFEGDIDVFISVDTPTVDRMGDSADLMERAKLTISLDHHPEEGIGADLAIIDTQAASASMLVWDLAMELTDGHPGSDVAMACYMGIVTDTGRFQFQNTDARALQSATAMAREGADPATICTEVYQSRTAAALMLEGRLLSRLSTTPGGLVAWAWINETDYDELGASKEDTEGLIDSLRCVAGAEVALLVQGRKNDIRCSIRSKHDFDVSEIAHEFGGGGHKAASGFTISGKLEHKMDFIESLVDSIEQRVAKAYGLDLPKLGE